MTTTATASAGAIDPDWVPFRDERTDAAFLPFGRAELLYALLADPQPSAVETAARLGIADDEINDATRIFGASTLYAQGQLVTEDGETFVPVREAALLSRAASLLDAWITIGRIGFDDAILGLLVDDACILIAEGPLRGFAASMVPADRLLDAIGQIVEGRLDAEQGATSPVYVLREDRAGTAGVLFVRPHPAEPDAFEAAVGTTLDSKPPILPGAKSPDEVDELLAGVLGVDPDTGELRKPGA